MSESRSSNKSSVRLLRRYSSNIKSKESALGSLLYDHKKQRYVKRTDKQIHDDIIQKLREERSMEKRNYHEQKDNDAIKRMREEYFEKVLTQQNDKQRAMEAEETTSQVKIYKAEKNRKKIRKINERREHMLAKREAKILYREQKNIHALKTTKPRSFVAAKEKAWKLKQEKRQKLKIGRELEKKRRYALVKKEIRRENERIQLEERLKIKQQEKQTIISEKVDENKRLKKWNKRRMEEKNREELAMKRERAIIEREQQRHKRETNMTYLPLPTRLSSSIQRAPLKTNTTSLKRLFIFIKDLLVPSSITEVDIIVNILYNDSVLWNATIKTVPDTLCSIPIDFSKENLKLQMYHAFSEVIIPIKDILNDNMEASQWDIQYSSEEVPKRILHSEKDTEQENDCLIHSIPLHPAMLFAKIYTSPYIKQKTLELEREKHLKERFDREDQFELPTLKKIKFYPWQPSPSDDNVKSLSFWVDQARRDEWFKYIKQKRHASIKEKRKHVNVQY
mmetsp:Transcript_14256/g.21548  ORF Transcript_14256/g.21548 Transcript_14256/m.21548 type:complete len:507 (+) Transcript_14256:25-1545(+)